MNKGAHRIGFVEQVVTPKRLMAAAYELAKANSKKSPIGLRMVKEALNRVEFMPVEEGYDLEQQYSSKLLLTRDAREATRAAIERREPMFKER